VNERWIEVENQPAHSVRLLRRSSGKGRNERKGVGGRKEEKPVEEIFLMARVRLMIYRV